MICRAWRQSRAAPRFVRGAIRHVPAAGSRRWRRRSAAPSRKPTSRICRLRPYSSFITATPAPAGTTVINCFGSMRITSGIQLAGYPESCCSHCRSTPVRRGAIPADGSSRAQAADHAQPRGGRLTQQCAVSIDHGLLLHRNPDVGRIAAQGFAEKSGRRDADHREGMALDNKGGTDHRMDRCRKSSARRDG